MSAAANAHHRWLPCLIQDSLTRHRVFWPLRHELTITSGIILRGQRIYIPPALHSEMLALIHTGHQGEVRCKLRAASSVWWPGLATAISNLVANCPQCAEHRLQPVEPLMATATPERPWHTIGVDFFQHTRTNWLVVVDYYSRYPEVITVSSTTANNREFSHVTNQLKTAFTRVTYISMVAVAPWTSLQFSSNCFVLLSFSKLKVGAFYS